MLSSVTSVIPACLESITRLVAELGRQSIAYCYWKSSLRLKSVMAGDADLDLLVDKADQHRIARVLLDRDFKPFPSVAMRDHLWIVSYLGFDEPSGRFVHVHLHLEVAAGGKLLKNYRLPFARALLERAVPHPLWRIRTLDSESEAVLLAVRACLEMDWTDPVTLRHWDANRRKFALDRADLSGRVDRAAFAVRATELLGADGARLVDKWVYRPGEAHAGTPRRRVRRHFAEYRTYGGAEAALRGAGRALHWLAGGVNREFLRLPRPWSRRAPGGGCVVALLGVDGSGKTTVNKAIRAWLGAEVDTLPIYFGTGDGRPSLLLLPLKMLVPLATRLVRRKPRGSSHGTISDRAPGVTYGGLLMIWAGMLAVEKRQKLRAARRGASRGLVMVSDRFPQDENPDYNDGPLLPRLRWAPAWLRRFEARSYALARRLPPDLVIKLDAPPELLAVREPGMDRRVIRERVAALRELTFPGVKIVRVDASAPLDDVISNVKRAVWAIL